MEKDGEGCRRIKEDRGGWMMKDAGRRMKKDGGGCRRIKKDRGLRM